MVTCCVTSLATVPLGVTKTLLLLLLLFYFISFPLATTYTSFHSLVHFILQHMVNLIHCLFKCVYLIGLFENYSLLITTTITITTDDLESKEVAARKLGLMLQKSTNLMTSSTVNSTTSSSNLPSFLTNRSNYNFQGGFRSSLGASVAAAAAAAAASSSTTNSTSSAAIKKKLREEEKKRLKEEEKLAKRASKSSKKKSKNSPQLNDFVQSGNNLIPLFVEKCITFIETEGLDSEGIYRVPGNRAHVDLLFLKFDEGKF